MGKSVGGAVWLNAERLSPYEYWQFWRNTEDADVGRFLRLFTELPLDEIARLEDGEINDAKKILATEATALVPWPGGCAGGGRDRARRSLRKAAAASELPQTGLPRELLERGVAAVELFSRAGLAASNGEARRLIRGGGARLNDRRHQRRDAASCRSPISIPQECSSSAPAASATPWSVRFDRADHCCESANRSGPDRSSGRNNHTNPAPWRFAGRSSAR